MSLAHTSTRRVVLDGAWLRHQAKAAIVAYFSPLAAGVDDKSYRTPSNLRASQTAEREAMAVATPHDSIHEPMDQ
jgi:hypothetical protein